jgi:hypothetical protein
MAADALCSRGRWTGMATRPAPRIVVIRARVRGLAPPMQRNTLRALHEPQLERWVS